MHNIPYLSFCKQIGLSNHPHQLQRRKTKYPLHFNQQGGQHYISYAYAKFLIACQEHALAQCKIKLLGNTRGGGHA